MMTNILYQQAIDFFLHTSVVVAHAVGFIGVLIMAYGGLRSGGMFLFCVLKRQDHLANIRIELATHLALGLEFLVGKDIIETIIEPSWEDLGKLAAIVTLRTIVTIFLSWELKDLQPSKK